MVNKKGTPYMGSWAKNLLKEPILPGFENDHSH